MPRWTGQELTVEDAGIDVRRRRSRLDPIPLGAQLAVVLGVPLATAAGGLRLGLAPVPLGLLVAAAACPWPALRAARRLGRRLRPGRGRPEPVRPRPAAVVVAPAVLAGLPPELRRQVERIQRKAELVRGSEPGRPPGVPGLPAVRRLLQEYLPTTLDAYLALPPGADGWMATPDRTVLQVLADQLEILETALDEAAAEAGG